MGLSPLKTEQPDTESSQKAPAATSSGAVEGSAIPSQANEPDAAASPSRRRRRSSASKGSPEKPADRPAPTPSWDPETFHVLPVEGKVRFQDLNLPAVVMRAVFDLGFQYCTPIQAEIMPSTLAGKDASGRAQTGTGKTAAFLITVITRLLAERRVDKDRRGTPRVLVLAPTRELVMQISEEGLQLAKYTDLSIVPVFGGMDYEKQRRQLSQTHCDIVVATPGRLLDFKRQGDVRLDQVEVLIIDEADRMLDMGFIPDVRKIISATPPKNKRQTLLFSATLTPEVIRLAAQWTTQPVMVEIEPQQVAVDTVEQLVYIVTREDKYVLLYNIIAKKNLERVIVFCNRKDETRKLADLFTRYQIDCAVLSGDVRQRVRVRTLDDFKAGKIRILVATDVAGRGIHIEGMDHVINYTLPRDPEDYVHRIGRTGRAGAAGTSISFADEEDSFYIPAIEVLIGHKLPCIQPEDEWLAPPPPPPAGKRKPSRPREDGASDAEAGGRPRKRGNRSGSRPSPSRPRSPRSNRERRPPRKTTEA
ncbi:MAG: ATP-dependent RNA helicase RhlB [Desulfobacterales bacterium]|nr:ATP-dependent RNA helicase RhlB [Desulfobacterales bacterium]